jgi:DNA-binding MarR family transcriptional regulator
MEGYVYLEIIRLIPVLTRHLHKRINLELSRSGDFELTSMQALMLFTLGDREMSIGELTRLGCYLGSNASYNIKSLTSLGYVEQERGLTDRRYTYVRLSPKGRAVWLRLKEMFRRDARAVPVPVDGLVPLLGRLEGHWAALGEGAVMQEAAE